MKFLIEKLEYQIEIEVQEQYNASSFDILSDENGNWLIENQDIHFDYNFKSFFFEIKEGLFYKNHLDFLFYSPDKKSIHQFILAPDNQEELNNLRLKIIQILSKSRRFKVIHCDIKSKNQPFESGDSQLIS